MSFAHFFVVLTHPVIGFVRNEGFLVDGDGVLMVTRWEGEPMWK